MAAPKENPLMEKIVSLCKRRGFIFQSSEIYGGINGFWDYGPLGAELKRNVKDLWWRTMIQDREDVVGLEATIIMAPQIWKASGHVDTFSDPMCDCLLTGKRFRADQIEPQSGWVASFAGAVDFDSFRKLADEGESPERSTIWQRVDLAPHLRTLLMYGPQMSPDASTGFLDMTGSFTSELEESIQAVAKSRVIEEFSTERFSVMEIGDSPKSFTWVSTGKGTNRTIKVAQEFYRRRGIKRPLVFAVKLQRVENSQHFNPENGAELTPARPFNLMFKTYVGPVADEENVAYLRPETAQAIFAQFKNVLETSRQKIPFGIAQMGKAFRNEVTPRNFTFRSREFEQMELEFFIRPDEAVEAIAGRVAAPSETPREGTRPTDVPSAGEPQANWGWEAWHKYWVEERIRFYESIGLPRATLEEYWQKPEELAHYARATVDILYKFPFGTQELEGIAARSDFDLSQHERFSGKPMGVFDDELRAAWARLDETKKKELWQRYYDARHKYLTKTGVEPKLAEKEAKEDADGLAKGQYIPHVIEPSAGVDRLILALICNAYAEDQAPDEKGNLETRVVMRFHPRIAPVKVAVFPLLRNKPDLVNKAKEVRDLLRPHMSVFYDDAGAIGRRYRRQDEAGTPFGVTIDFDTLGEKGPELKETVTLRDRDTMKQERVKISGLPTLLLAKIR
jgi:glycyl-tRNA synthetase